MDEESRLSTDLLELNWFFREPECVTANINAIRVKADLYYGRNISEEDTLFSLVQPVLRGLGWDTTDNEQVQYENRAGLQVADAHLVHEKTVRVLIEAKCRDHDLRCCSRRRRLKDCPACKLREDARKFLLSDKD